jgi:tetratricopeptide (TPR) repeat protein
MTTSDPKTLSEQATRSYQDGDFVQAAQLFEQAAQAYLDSGNALDAAEMRNNQSVALLQESDAQGALNAALGTDTIFAEAGDIRRQGMAIGNQAAALEELKRVDEAIPLYQSAAELLGEAGEDQMRALVMQSLAMIYIKRGKFYDGLFAMNDGLRGLKNPTLKQKVLRQILKLRTW